MNYHKVNGHPNLIRDTSTKAILNTNNTEYQNYVALKKSKEMESKRMEDIESNMNELKNDIDEIKQLLLKLSEK